MEMLISKEQKLRRALKLAAWGAGGGLVIALLLVWVWTRDLPAFDTLKDYRPLLVTNVHGSDGSVVFQFSRERRTVVPFHEIPVVMRQAVLAAEDARFYEHQGINYLAILRCALKGGLQGKVVCGGSTITQQVVKTFLLTQERKLSRKVKELVLAKRLEQNLQKDEILYLYLNQIYFGHHRYGVEEASRFYFGKSVRELTLGEAAMLAGVVVSPEKKSPAKYPEAAKERQRYVLRRMVEEGFIPQEQADAEAQRPILVASHPPDPPGAYYADAVKRHLVERYGLDRVETEGLLVEVAMDPAMQKAAEDGLEAALRAVDKRQGWRGPLDHLDEPQVAAALPLWKERLKATRAKPGELLVWDLGHVSAEDIEPSEKGLKDLKKRLRTLPLEEEGRYTALVTAVTDKTATVDLGNASGTLPLSEMKWARKFNPTSGTAAPRKASDVVKRGDLVTVRVVRGKQPAVDLARADKPVAVALEQVPLVQGAFVAIDPVTRGVRALVGGYDFQRDQFNRAFQAKRQPGSAFKPFVWGAAIDSQQFTPATIVYDAAEVYRDPWTGKEWKPRNFERDVFDGPMLLKAALAHSKNTVAAKLVHVLGVETVIDFAQRSGIQSKLPANPSLALGTGEVTPLELVNAYATIAAYGRQAQPITVIRVRDNTGQVLEELAPDPGSGAMAFPPPGDDLPPAQPPGAQPAIAQPAPGAQPEGGDGEPADPELGTGNAIRPEVAYVLLSMMRDVVEYGTAMSARSLGRPVAAKTGTAQDHKDAWFVGFIPELVAGVWVGFNDATPMGPRETGAGAALPAWLSFMQQVTQGWPVTDFPPPPNVEFVRIDPVTGLLATPPGEGAPEPVEGGAADPNVVPFLAGTAPTQVAPPPGQPGDAPQNFFQDDR
jgi:penicillin-binding protein 1A